MNKLIIAIMCITVFMLSFSACDSKSDIDRAREDAYRAQQYADDMQDKYNKAKQDSNKLKNDIADYKDAVGRLN